MQRFGRQQQRSGGSEQEDERLRLRVVEGKQRANVHLKFLQSLVLAAQYVHINALRDKRRTVVGVATGGVYVIANDTVD